MNPDQDPFPEGWEFAPLTEEEERELDPYQLVWPGHVPTNEKIDYPGEVDENGQPI